MEKVIIAENHLCNFLIAHDTDGNCITFDVNFENTLYRLKTIIATLENDNEEYFYFDFNASWMDEITKPANFDLINSWHLMLEACFNAIKDRKLYIMFRWNGDYDKYVELFEATIKRHPKMTGLVIRCYTSIDYIRLFDVIKNYPQIDTVEFHENIINSHQHYYNRETPRLLTEKLEHCVNLKTLKFHKHTFKASHSGHGVDSELIACLVDLYFVDSIKSYSWKTRSIENDILTTITDRNKAIKRSIYDATLTYLMLAKRKDNIISSVGKDVNLMIAKLIYKFKATNNGIKAFCCKSE